MFKVGDKFRYKEHLNQWNNGEIYFIIHKIDKDGYPWYRTKDGREYFDSKYEEDWELIKKEIKTEVDWLNAVQQNMKE